MRKLTTLNIFFLCLIFFFTSGFIAFPLYSLLKEGIPYFSLPGSSFSEIISGSVLNSVILSVITLFGSMLIGVSLAYLFRYRNFPLKSFFYTLLLVPIAAPPLVGVVAFLFLLNDNGLLTKLLMQMFSLQSPPFRFDGWSAIIIIHIYSFYPFYLLFATSSLMKIDVNLIDASRSLGASSFRTFSKVIFPQLVPGIVGASLIVFMASMASFSAPFIFGGSTRFLTTEIYSSKINGDTSLAAMLSLLLTIISVIFLILLRAYRKRHTFESRTKGTIKVSSSASVKNSGLVMTGLAFIAALIIMLPILALMYLSLIPEGSLMRNFFEEPVTFDNYTNIFSSSQFFEPFTNSLQMAVIAVLITVIIGVSASFLISRKKIKGGNILESFLSLPYGIPGTVIALSFILSFNSPTIFTAFTPIVGTFIIIPLAYAVRNIPVIMQSSLAGFNAFDPSLEEASSSLGAKGVRTFRKVIFPVILPSVLSGAMLVFINSIGEFVSTILLYTYSTKTISVEIYSQLRVYNTGAAASYGVMLFLLVMLIVYLSRKTLDRSVGA